MLDGMTTKRDQLRLGAPVDGLISSLAQLDALDVVKELMQAGVPTVMINAGGDYGTDGQLLALDMTRDDPRTCVHALTGRKNKAKP